MGITKSSSDHWADCYFHGTNSLFRFLSFFRVPFTMHGETWLLVNLFLDNYADMSFSVGLRARTDFLHIFLFRIILPKLHGLYGR